MKTILLLLLGALPVLAQSTINSTQKYAWAGNTGWLDFRPDAARGFRFGEFSCAGWIWSPNIGWIDCGDGMPVNHINYGNDNNSDYGVNHYGTGNLYGMAWSPNTGWINFGWANLDPENPNRPRVDLTTGEFSGYAWGANTGWISLAGVKTDRMEFPDSDNDGISDAYEYAYTGGLGTLGKDADADKDGHSDKEEYLTMTNPIDSQSFFKVTAVAPNPGGSETALTWTSAPNRRYVIEVSTDLGMGDPWHKSALDPQSFTADAGSSTTRTSYDIAAPKRFFRVGALIPLQP
ncbi:MAG: hypothetical protein V4819_09105 [Verrucomicrobiota bacterium]